LINHVDLGVFDKQTGRNFMLQPQSGQHSKTVVEQKNVESGNENGKK
jgi:hypothetical protein